jgi:hypothetical protein
VQLNHSAASIVRGSIALDEPVDRGDLLQDRARAGANDDVDHSSDLPWSRTLIFLFDFFIFTFVGRVLSIASVPNQNRFVGGIFSATALWHRTTARLLSVRGSTAQDEPADRGDLLGYRARAGAGDDDVGRPSDPLWVVGLEPLRSSLFSA